MFNPHPDVGLTFDPSEHPHRRLNPLTGKHVLVSPHRTKRPWKGQTESPSLTELPAFDEECYLCPGNVRSNGESNPNYRHTYVFDNDFPALLPAPPSSLESDSNPSLASSIFSTQPVHGHCRVICFSPRHDLTLSRMSEDDIVQVIKTWQKVYEEEGETIRRRSKRPETQVEGYVQIFENRGGMMGASAPHPHGQVWTLSYVPDEIRTELDHLELYSQSHFSSNPDAHRCLLCDYANEEIQRHERVVEIDEKGGWVAVVPFWATWPYEILLLPYKRHMNSISSLTPDETEGLARILKKVLTRYDNLFSCPFPYSMGLHQSPLPPPTDSGIESRDTKLSHVHFHFYPPLLRSATVRKFLVGFEMMAEVQRDLTPEQAAKRLCELSNVHYLDQRM